MTTSADQVRSRLTEAALAIHRAMALAGQSGPIPDKLAVRSSIEIATHHLERAAALLSRQP